MARSNCNDCRNRNCRIFKNYSGYECSSYMPDLGLKVRMVDILVDNSIDKLAALFNRLNMRIVDLPYKPYFLVEEGPI